MRVVLLRVGAGRAQHHRPGRPDSGAARPSRTRWPARRSPATGRLPAAACRRRAPSSPAQWHMASTSAMRRRSFSPAPWPAAAACAPARPGHRAPAPRCGCGRSARQPRGRRGVCVPLSDADGERAVEPEHVADVDFGRIDAAEALEGVTGRAASRAEPQREHAAAGRACLIAVGDRRVGAHGKIHARHPSAPRSRPARRPPARRGGRRLGCQRLACGRPGVAPPSASAR